MESLEREVQEYQTLLLSISTEADTTKREQMESLLLHKLSSAKFIAILSHVLPNPQAAGSCYFPSILPIEAYPSLSYDLCQPVEAVRKKQVVPFDGNN
jgi:hypothetical protein